MAGRCWYHIVDDVKITEVNECNVAQPFTAATNLLQILKNENNNVCVS